MNKSVNSIILLMRTLVLVTLMHLCEAEGKISSLDSGDSNKITF